MTCDKVRPQLTAYLDGELADDRGSVVRGHLRTCETCRAAARDEAALRDGLRALPQVDVPASLWAGVQARLAAEEVADAERPAWRRVLARWTLRMPRMPQLALGSVAITAAIVVIVVRAQQANDVASPHVSETSRIEPVVFAPQRDGAGGEPLLAAVADDARDISDALAAAPALITAEYAASAAELVPLAEEARARWTEDQQRAFDIHVAELQQAVASAPAERDRHRAYRALIRYLQRAAVRDEVALASIGGRP
jgi:anti-sigma factor RsiW